MNVFLRFELGIGFCTHFLAASSPLLRCLLRLNWVSIGSCWSDGVTLVGL